MKRALVRRPMFWSVWSVLAALVQMSALKKWTRYRDMHVTYFKTTKAVSVFLTAHSSYHIWLPPLLLWVWWPGITSITALPIFDTCRGLISQKQQWEWAWFETCFVISCYMGAHRIWSLHGVSWYSVPHHILCVRLLENDPLVEIERPLLDIVSDTKVLPFKQTEPGFLRVFLPRCSCHIRRRVLPRCISNAKNSNLYHYKQNQKIGSGISQKWHYL